MLNIRKEFNRKKTEFGIKKQSLQNKELYYFCPRFKSYKMKYRLLSKEQFEALHQEFSNFLATNGIDKKKWDAMKASEPKKVIGFLEKFSDIVWENVLNKTQFLEHFSKDSLNLFHCTLNSIDRIVVRVEKNDFDFEKPEDFTWFVDHSNDSSIKYFKGTKDYNESRNEELFSIIEQGAVLGDGKLYSSINQLIKSSN